MSITFDMSVWENIHTTHDGIYVAGQGGVQKILRPKDGRSEFVKLENRRVLVTFPSSKVAVYYPLAHYPFQPKAKAVLMDLDGTSIRSESFWIWIIEQTTAALLGDPQFRLAKEDEPFVSGFSVSEHLLYCIEKYNVPATLEQAREMYFELTRKEMREIMEGRGKQDAYTVTPGLKEFLLALKENNIKIGLVTSGLYEKAMPEILSGFRQLGMGDPLYFYDAVITAGTTYGPGQSGTLGELSAKPHPWLYREVCEVGLGIHEEDFNRVVVLEDSSAGVLAGYLAGFDVIGMTGGNIESAGLAPMVHTMAETLAQALEIILGKEK